MKSKKLINYFRDCYRADQRELNIWSIFDKKIEHRLVLEGKEELLNGNIPQQYIDDDKAKAILKTLQLYRKEKQLKYFSFFITGKTNSDLPGKNQLCAPLLYYPAEIIEEDEIFYIKVDFSKQQLNYPLISMLSNNDNADTEYLENIFKEIPKSEITFKECEFIKAALAPYLTDVDFEQLFLYPEQTKEKALRAQSRKLNLQLLPGSALGVIEVSKNTRGVINELTYLGKSDELSRPLKILFNASSEEKTYTENYIKGWVPAVLSDSQKRIVKNASTSPLSIAIGPPGTGKSYTIASLAVDHISKGKSVLIVSKMDHAVDVVADKIENQLGVEGCVVRAGKSAHLKSLKAYIKNMLSGMLVKQTLPSIQKKEDKLRDDLKYTDQEVEGKKVIFSGRISDEMDWASFLSKHENETNFFYRFFGSFKEDSIHKKNENLPQHWDLVLDIEGDITKRNILIARLLQTLNQKNILNTDRKQVRKFLSAISARTDGKQEDLFKEIDFRKILRLFPVWLVNVTELYDVLPLYKELFDLVIIDEATQCDIASCLPAIYRAKKAVITGDPHQLRHLSFLSRARQKILLQKNGLDDIDPEDWNYREKSILDFANDHINEQDKITFLDEHFRSLPDIIAFSNHKFYNNALHIMTQNPITESKKCLELIECNGTRNKKGVNETEAAFILDKINEVIDEEADLSKNISHKIGILSPFRDQVEYLRTQISDHISISNIQKHDILVGTAHSFQGEERDIMFLSFAVDNDSHAGSFLHLNKPDVFNVAITRAKTLQYVLTSFSSSKLKEKTNLREYLGHIKDGTLYQKIDQQSSLISCDFEEAVRKVLESHDFICHTAYPIAGMNIDLIIQKNKKLMGINLVGFPGEFEAAFSLERYQMLNRAGLIMIPIPYTIWTKDQQKCIDAIEGAFQRV